MNNYQEKALNDAAKVGFKALGGFFKTLDDKLQNNGWYDEYENVTLKDLNNKKVTEMIRDAQD